MEPSIEFQDKNGYLRCHVSGVDSLSFSVAYFSKAAEECKQRGLSKVLIVDDSDGQLDAYETFAVAKTLPELFRGIKMAFVDFSPEDLQVNMFGEDVSANRGLFVKLFSNESIAEQWLLSP